MADPLEFPGQLSEADLTRVREQFRKQYAEPPPSAFAKLGSDLLGMLGQGVLLTGCFILAALAAICFGIWTLCALAIAAACRPGFWLGVVVVAVLTRMMGVW